MLSPCIELAPQYGQYFALLVLVDIPIIWNLVLQLLHTYVAAAIIHNNILQWVCCKVSPHLYIGILRWFQHSKGNLKNLRELLIVVMSKLYHGNISNVSLSVTINSSICCY
jgi:hypothetical protein